MTKEYEPNLERSLHFYKTHAAVSSNRESVMITESWNFNTSHGTSLNNNKSDEIMTEKQHGHLLWVYSLNKCACIVQHPN